MQIVDIGCGDKKFPGSIGVDKNYDEADYKMDIDEENLPFEDNSIDLVVSNDSIEHMGNPKHVFKEVYRILKPGGKFRIETVNVSVWWIRLFIFLDWNVAWRHKIGTKRTGHMIHFTPDMLDMWFEMNGFKPLGRKNNFLFRYKITQTGIKKCD